MSDKKPDTVSLPCSETPAASNSNMPEISDIPDKLYFKIGEVCGLTRVAAHVLRFWESEFSQINPRRTDAGQRLYTRSDIERILEIKHLLHDKKFTIKGAKRHLKASRKNADIDRLLKDISSELLSIRDSLG